MAPGQTTTTCVGCGSAVNESLANGLCVACLARHLSAASPRPPEGREVGRTLPAALEPIDHLGRGGMGVVTLAYQRSLGRYVAIKQLAGVWLHDTRARDRFLREARAAARLAHPGIVPILEVGEEGEDLWFSMEYLEGGDLVALLKKRGGALPWREAVELTAHVADAIQHAHAAGIAHRDLKPSNILLSANGRPKVCDFGLAWLASQESRNLTATGEIVGTPAYMAPEALVASAPDSDARPADVYALGAVLFHLVAGRPPFTGDTTVQLLHAISQHEAPRLSDITTGRLEHPRSLDLVCARCLEKDPADRFKSAGDLSAALRACLTDQRAFFPRLRRRTIRRILIGTAVALSIAGLATVLPRPGRAPAADTLAARQRPLVVVLPLRALTDDTATRSLAAGLHEELVSAITRISDLRVISLRSQPGSSGVATEPTASTHPAGVTAVLETSVQHFQTTVRFVARLVDPGNQSVLSTQTFDRLETNLFNLQTDIATAIAVHLKARLLATRDAAVRGTSSTLPAAQALFLRARALAADASDSIGQLDEAEELLTEAVRIDPTFALAHARLSLNHTLKYHWGNDRTETRLRLGLDAAHEALRLNPDLPEAAIALGCYYMRGTRDHVTARPHLERALELAPNNAAALEALANAERRTGDFLASAGHYREAITLDPFNPILAYNGADTFLRLRDYETSSEILEAALARMPRHVALVKLRGDLHLAWKGDLGPMEDDLQSRDPSLPTPEACLGDRIDWLVLAGRVDEAIATLDASDFGQLGGQSFFTTRAGFRAILCQLAGRTDEATAGAREALPEVERILRRNPDDPRLLLHAAELTAILGEVDDAVQLVRRTLTPGDLACVDAFDRGFFQYSLAILLGMHGRRDEALATIRSLLQEPNQYSERRLALHPAFRSFANEWQ